MNRICWSNVVRLLTAAVVTLAVSVPLKAQLEFRYEFDTTEGPLVDSTGNHANLGLGSNGVEHRFGEGSLIGGDGFSIGLDAPGEGHPTGSYLVVPDAPQPESFSYSVWINPLLTGTTQAIIDRDNVWWPSPCAYYCLYIDNLQSLVWKTGTVETIITDEGIIEEGETYHLVVTHSDTDGADTDSADRSRLYVNGEMIAEENDPTEIPSLESIADDRGIYELLWLGTMSSFGGFLGEMDDFQLYSAELTPEQVAEMYANPGSVATFGGTDGDFDGNGTLDAADADQLIAEITSGANGAAFDLTSDGNVDQADLIEWVTNIKKTWIGDADLNGEFDSSDFVSVFTAGKYETGEAAGWGEGDWNGDGVFDSGDFVAAFTDGGYEIGQRVSQAVPEPTSCFSLLVLAALCVRRRFASRS